MMAAMTEELSFDALRDQRRQLRDYLKTHHQRGIDSFATKEELPFSGFTRSATCLESLQSGAADDTRCFAFSDAALKSDRPWHSDGAAAIYCASRTLPIVMRYQRSLDNRERVEALLRLVWSTVAEVPGCHGVSEMIEAPKGWPSKYEPPGAGRAEVPLVGPTKKEDGSYPSNTFHTYWALRSLEEYGEYLARFEQPNLLTAQLSGRATLSWGWCRSVLSLHTALGRARSQAFDGDQLGWALATRFRWSARRFAAAICDPASESSLSAPPAEERDLLRAGLETFFASQLENGRWPRFAPIFHYPKAGNAYCYFFETLAELIRPCLHADAHELRLLLRPYLPRLIRTAQYAKDTAMDRSGGAIGWCSGHHPHRTDPESWATAAVFLFLQNLRKLLAIETRDVAKRELGARQVSDSDATKLGERGQTWVPAGYDSRPGVAELLSTLFIHPIVARKTTRLHEDPDTEVFDKASCRKGKDWARSAILFGPPGTSKTSLVSAVAASICWPLVELHASHFLAEGIDRIPARADWIFSRLMELDRCVVLFDELDELIGNRTKPESDPFGRFLTTLMLPKLAELWKQRRILYFLNTNLINTADDAIRRSERFDANILVETPSLEVKKKLLGAVVNNWGAISNEARELLALVRYDQLSTLADYLRTDASLDNALRKMFPKGNEQLPQLKQMRDEYQLDHRAERMIVLRLNEDGNGLVPPKTVATGNVEFVFYDHDRLDLYYFLDGEKAPATVTLTSGAISADFSLSQGAPGVMTLVAVRAQQQQA